MRTEIKAYRWSCDLCGVNIVTFTLDYPEGWDEKDDNPEGECQDYCKECLDIQGY